jgi:hypothetical protein
VSLVSLADGQGSLGATAVTFPESDGIEVIGAEFATLPDLPGDTELVSLGDSGGRVSDWTVDPLEEVVLVNGSVLGSEDFHCGDILLMTASNVKGESGRPIIFGLSRYIERGPWIVPVM